jgi:hypothetical protein
MGTAGGYPGQTPAVVAIVADNVTDVWLDHNNERRAVSIVNNSIYVDQVGVHTGDRVALVFEYADGTTREIVVPNSGGSWIGAVRFTLGSRGEDWPTTDYEEVDLPPGQRPSSGELDNECRSKEAAGTCQTS